MAEEKVEELSAEIAGQKLSLKSVALNTLATVATLITTSVICVLVWQHQTEAKDGAKAVATELKEANKEVANTLKESNKEIGKVLNDLARAIRERNCLDEFPAEKRAENAERCKRLSQ